MVLSLDVRRDDRAARSRRKERVSSTYPVLLIFDDAGTSISRKPRSFTPVNISRVPKGPNVKTQDSESSVWRCGAWQERVGKAY